MKIDKTREELWSEGIAKIIVGIIFIFLTYFLLFRFDLLYKIIEIFGDVKRFPNCIYECGRHVPYIISAWWIIWGSIYLYFHKKGYYD